MSQSQAFTAFGMEGPFGLHSRSPLPSLVPPPSLPPSHPPARRPRKISPEEIVERCFYALINEGFRCLEEGIAEHPNDIDVVWAYGYAWPGWRGGPMFWADEIGARTLVRQMVRFGSVGRRAVPAAHQGCLVGDRKQ